MISTSASLWNRQVGLFFSLGLWAMIHFAYVARLGRLARQVRKFGESNATEILPLAGVDELHDLSIDFAATGQRLAEREREQEALEREVIGCVENERRRIGHELHDGTGQHLTCGTTPG